MVSKGRKYLGLFRNQRLCYFVCIEQKRTNLTRGCEFDGNTNQCHSHEGNVVVGNNETNHYCAVLQTRAQEEGLCVADEGQTLDRFGLLPPDPTPDFGAKECLQQCINKQKKDGLQ